jgi:hypothetical protein
MTDTATQLRTAADLIRGHAAKAANDIEDDELCCWDFERLGGHERVIEVRQHPDGTDDGIIAVPTSSGIAPHIALWDPTNAVAVADLLDTIAAVQPEGNAGAMIWWKALALAKLLDAGRDHEVVIGAGSPETSALTHCPTCGAPQWHEDGRRGWNPADVECEDCADTYSGEEDG